MHYVHQAEPVEPEERPVGSEESSAGEEPPPALSSAPVTRVRQSLVSSGDEQPVSRAQVLRGYEVEPERYVTFRPDELRRLQRKTSPNMEIVRSVLLSEIDPVFFETSYYVVPDRGGEKPYAILFQALRQSQHVALARVGMYGREHVVIVRPGGHGILAHTMFYVDEVRSENEFRTDVAVVSAKELELAKTFLRAIEAPFAPEEFKDVYREELQALIEKKMSETEAAPAATQPSAAQKPVVDIMEALKKSIAMARKPPGRVTEIKGKRQPRKAR
jgi:DNA end-binding protein Ku